MSAGILMRPEKRHSPLDDLQSVLWVGLGTALDYLHHKQRLHQIAQCYTEYLPITQNGGQCKSNFLRDAVYIEFTNNPAFSRLIQNFCLLMSYADNWESAIFYKNACYVELFSSLVPDHSKILDLFHKALESPDSEWSPERHHEHLLQNAMADLQVFMTDFQLHIGSTTDS